MRIQFVHITRHASTKSADALMSGRRLNRAYSGRHATKKDNTTPRYGMFPAPWAGRLSTRLCPDASTSEASDDLQGALGHNGQRGQQDHSPSIRLSVDRLFVSGSMRDRPVAAQVSIGALSHAPSGAWLVSRSIS